MAPTRFPVFVMACLTLVASCPGHGQDAPDSLTSELTALLNHSGLPGFAVAIVGRDSILYQRGFGFADIDKQIPFTEHTIQNIGSISKTTIGVALMRLVAEGKTTLDTEINTILPFPVVNPHAPDTPIRIRHLATHTSGIADSRMYAGKSYYLIAPAAYTPGKFPRRVRAYLRQIAGNKPMPLGDFLKEYLTAEGAFYLSGNYTRHAAGSAYRYSNVGAALAAYVVEILAGQPYREFTKTHILDELDMTASGWRLDDIDLSAHATLYFPNRAPVPRYALATYPDGGLLTNCRDLARYLQEMMRGYCGESDLLPPAAFREMMRIQFETEHHRSGMFWDINREGGIGHNGADPGVFTYIHFNPGTRYGKVFLTNVSAYEKPSLLKSFKAIWSALSRYGKQLQPDDR